MPVSTTEKTALTQAHQVLAGLISALVVDPVPNPLEVALAAVTAERDELALVVQRATADMESLVEQRNALQTKLDAKAAAMDELDAADAAADAAEAAEDAARARARNAGE